MGPELSTTAANQNFAWICKQPQDLIGLVLIFRTKIIWSGPEFGLVRSGYLNAASKCPKILNTKTEKNTLNLFSLLTTEAKGSNQFCKGRQFNCLPLQNWLLPSQKFWYFPFLNYDFTVQFFRTFTVCSFKPSYQDIRKWLCKALCSKLCGKMTSSRVWT